MCIRDSDTNVRQQVDANSGEERRKQVERDGYLPGKQSIVNFEKNTITHHFASLADAVGRKSLTEITAAACGRTLVMRPASWAQPAIIVWATMRSILETDGRATDPWLCANVSGSELPCLPPCAEATRPRRRLDA